MEKLKSCSPTQTIVGLILISLLSGCMQVITPQAGDRAESRLLGGQPLSLLPDEDVPRSISLPSELRALLGPEAPASLVLDGPEEPRFDVTANDVPVRAFFQGMIEETPYNIVVHPEVTGTVTLTLNDVSVPEVMMLMRDGYGFHFERTPAGFVVMPDTMQSRLFSLDYLNLDRTGSTGTRISAGDISAGTEEGNRVDDLAGSQLQTVSRYRLWGEVEAMIDRMIADEKPRGASVVGSPEGGALVVRASPRALARVESFIERLDATLNRQVVLEARILEVVLNDDLQSGIDWNAVGTENRAPAAYSLDQGAQISINPDTVFSLGILQEGNFEATIRALQSQGNVQILSAPRISTLNNVKALIKVGTDAFFQTGIELNTENFQGERFTEIVPEFSPFFSGIALDVTPNISQDGWVTLHVQPSVTNVQEVARSLDLGQERASFQLASSEVRQADSIVRARDGDMVVIGGLIQEREEQVVAGVPVLGEMPLLKWFFGNTRNISRQVELVILIRPRIIGADVWEQEVERTVRRFEEIYGS